MSKSRIFHALESLGVATISAAALCMLGAPAVWAAPAAATPSAAQPGVQQAPYLNGGIGENNQEKMKAEASRWPLHLTFSAGPKNEYLADVQLSIHDHQGAEVLKLDQAGPLTYVRLAPGEYRIRAEHKGQKEERTLKVGKHTAASFHWGK